jgi:transcriptional regulator with XRE-family HTH domain
VIEEIKEYLDKTGINQTELAEKTGIHLTIISDILNGKRALTDIYIARLVRAGVIDAAPLDDPKIKEAALLGELDRSGIDLKTIVDIATSLRNISAKAA